MIIVVAPHSILDNNSKLASITFLMTTVYTFKCTKFFVFWDVSWTPPNIYELVALCCLVLYFMKDKKHSLS